MLRSEKKDSVSFIQDILNTTNTLLIVHYQGLTVGQMAKLRGDLRVQGVSLKVVKNTLAKIAAVNVGLEISNMLSGPTAIVYSNDPVAAAKVVCQFLSTNEKLKIIGGVLDNQLLTVNDVNTLSKLPSLDELRARLVAQLQSPAQKLLALMKEPGAQIARLLNSYANKE